VVVVRWLILIDLKWLELLDIRILQMGFCIYSLSNNNLREVGLLELYITKKKEKKRKKKRGLCLRVGTYLLILIILQHVLSIIIIKIICILNC
jgi:hypothetical protein